MAGEIARRVRVMATENGLWYTVILDRNGNELSLGPFVKTEAEAEAHRTTYLRFGAWRKS